MGLAPILVVDDESDMRTALSHALSRGGFSVESVVSGTEALSKLKKDPFSMVITDLKIPDMSGMEVLGAAYGSLISTYVGLAVMIIWSFKKDLLKTYRYYRDRFHNNHSLEAGTQGTERPPANSRRPSCRIGD